MSGVEFENFGKFDKKIKTFLDQSPASSYSVGFFKNARYPQDRGGLPVATVAAIQEFGDPAAHIPERSFFRTANATYEKKLLRTIVGFLKRNHKLTIEDVSILASAHQKEIQASIAYGHWAPNAPSTIKQKQRKKGKRQADLPSSKPLIDEGIMRNSVTFVVDK